MFCPKGRPGRPERLRRCRERHTLRPSEGRNRGLEPSAAHRGAIGAPMWRHINATSEEPRRKSDVPGISVTRPDFGDGPVALPCPSGDDPSPLPTYPAVSATATACQGRRRDGLVPFPGRQLPEAWTLSPGASLRGLVPCR